MLVSFFNVLIGIVLGNIGHLAVKDPTSSASPTRFSFLFWVKDNYLKLLHSLVIAGGLNLAFQLNIHEIEAALGFKWYNIYAVGLGLFPDAVLSFLKNKFGFLQPKKVSIKNHIYQRKDEQNN